MRLPEACPPVAPLGRWHGDPDHSLHVDALTRDQVADVRKVLLEIRSGPTLREVEVTAVQELQLREIHGHRCPTDCTVLQSRAIRSPTQRAGARHLRDEGWVGGEECVRLILRQRTHLPRGYGRWSSGPTRSGPVIGAASDLTKSMERSKGRFADSCRPPHPRSRRSGSW